MHIDNNRQAGFGTIAGIVVAVVVLGLVGLIGWEVYTQQHQVTNTDTKTTGTAKPPAQPDQYAGWQIFCSTTGGLCFKYPAAWHKSETASAPSGGSVVTVTNPAQTVAVVYTPSVVGTGGHCKASTCFFAAEAMTPLSFPGASLAVVKGVYTNQGSGAILADYFLGSTDRLAPYHLQLHQAVDVGFFADLFTSPRDNSAAEELRVQRLPDDGFASVAEAQAWLTTPDVATAGKILTSVYPSTTNQ